ncbi:MAG TPA: response regulator transcription factor [Puia sp.]|nr:response regulator transcription factor [Puia sp.]
MKMNCIAVDDEPLALKLLADNIGKVAYLNLAATCSNAFEAMKALQENQIDLIFIDIQMPGLTGLQYISTLEDKPLVIFITAYKQYALESYDLSVVDYLVKPVSLERFVRACNRAKELYELKSLKNVSPVQATQEYFFVNSDYSQIKVIFSDITWMEGLRDYVKIYLKSTNKPLVIRSSLKSIEEQLPPNKFIRIHKSYLISIESIVAIRKNSVFIKDKELPVGDTYRESVDRLVTKKS